MADFDPDAYLSGQNGATATVPQAKAFDPDAYLKAQQQPASGQGFDPDAYLKTNYKALAADRTFDPQAYAAQAETDAETFHPGPQDPAGAAARAKQAYDLAYQVQQERQANPLPWDVPKMLSNAGKGIVSTVKGVGEGITNALDAAGEYITGGPDMMTHAAQATLAGQNIEESIKGQAHGLADWIDRERPDLSPEEREQYLRQDFRQNVDAAKRQLQLQQGRPLETGVVAALAGGKDIISQETPEALRATGAAPVDLESVQNMAAAANPENLALAAVPEIPGVSGIGAGALKVAGKALQLPADALESIGTHIPFLPRSPVTRAMFGGAGLAEAVPSIIAHPGAAIGAGLTAAAIYGGKHLGNFLTQVGEEIGGKLAPADRSIFGSIAAKGARGVASGISTAAGFAPINFALSEGDPQKFVESEIGAGMFGTVAGTAGEFTKDPLASRFFNADRARKGPPTLSTAPFDYNTTPDLDAANNAAMSRKTPEQQEEFNQVRHAMQGHVELYTLPEADFQKAQTDYAKATGSDPKATGNAFYDKANKRIVIREGARDPIQAAWHEVGHDVVNSMRQPDGSLNPDAQRAVAAMIRGNDMNAFTKRYFGALTGQTVTWDGLPETREQARAKGLPDNMSKEAMGEELLAEQTAAMMRGMPIDSLAGNKTIKRRLQDIAGRVAESLGYKVSTPEARSILGVNPSFTAAHIIEQALQGRAEGAGVAPAYGGDLTAKNRIAQLDKILATPPTSSSTVENVKAYQSAQRERESLAKTVNAPQGNFPAAQQPANLPGLPKQPAVSQAAAQARLDATEGLRKLGFKAAEIRDWINRATQQHGSAITDASALTRAVLKLSRGETVQPGEYNPKAPAPKQEAIVPVGRTFRDPEGQEHTVNGESAEPAKAGDYVVTATGEIRRIQKVWPDGSLDVTFPASPNGNTPMPVKATDYKVLAHEISAPVEPAKPSLRSQPASQVLKPGDELINKKTGQKVTVETVDNNFGKFKVKTADGKTEVYPNFAHPFEWAENVPQLKIVPGKGGSFDIVNEKGEVIKGGLADQAAANRSLAQLQKAKASTFTIPPNPAGAPDIIDAIMQQGGIAPKPKAGAAQEYDDLPQNMRGVYQQLMGGKHAPDEMARLLEGDNHGDGTVSTMWRTIEQAINARKSLREQQYAEQQRIAQEKKQTSEAPTTEANDTTPTTPPTQNQPVPPVAGTAVAEPPPGVPAPQRPQPLRAPIPDRATVDTNVEMARQKAVAAAQASPEYARKRGNPRAGVTKEQAQKDMLEEVGYNAGVSHIMDEIDRTGSPGLRRVVDPDGTTRIVGNFDLTNPLHAALVDLAGGISERADANVRALQNTRGDVQHIRYRSAKSQTEETPWKRIGMTERRGEYAEDPAADRTVGTIQHKTIMPVTTVLKGGRPMEVVFTLDNLLHNAESLKQFMQARGLTFPYADENLLTRDARVYADNHAHGWKGDGSAPMQGFPDGDMPRPDPNYQAQAIPKDRFDALNMLMFDENASKLAERQQEVREYQQKVKDAKTDKERARLQGVMDRAATRMHNSEEAHALADQNNPWVDYQTGETNELRAKLKGLGLKTTEGDLKSAGLDTKDAFKNPFETLDPQHILDMQAGQIPMQPGDVPTVRPTGFGIKAGELEGMGRLNQRAVAANFMPATEAGAENRPEATKERARLLWAQKGTDSPFFQKWFGNSKVVDEQGKPQIVFRGDPEQIAQFDNSQRGTRTGAPSAKQGFFFTTSEKVAGGYKYGDKFNVTALKNEADRLERIAQRSGKNEDWDKQQEAYIAYENAALSEENRANEGHLTQAYVSLQNPLVKDFEGKEYREESYNDLIKQARRRGNDGVIFKNTFDSASEETKEPTDIIVAFDPTQIKSATGNRGTFDPKEANINFMPSTPDEPQTPQEAARQRIAARAATEQKEQQHPIEVGNARMSSWAQNTTSDAPPNPFGENAKPYLKYAVDSAKGEMALEEAKKFYGIKETSRQEALKAGFRTGGELNDAINRLKEKQNPTMYQIAQKLGDILVKDGIYSRTEIDQVLQKLISENSIQNKEQRNLLYMPESTPIPAASRAARQAAFKDGKISSPMFMPNTGDLQTVKMLEREAKTRTLTPQEAARLRIAKRQIAEDAEGPGDQGAEMVHRMTARTPQK